MKEESRERILAVADWAIQRLGFKDWDEGLRFASAFLDALADKVRSINTREKLDALLSEMPEPTAKALDGNITTAKKLIYQFRGRMVRFAKDELPHSPGGHPRSVPVNKHDEICESILGLQRKRVQLGVAFERVAQQQSVARRRPVSARTIERIWQSRQRERETDRENSQSNSDV